MSPFSGKHVIRAGLTAVLAGVVNVFQTGVNTELSGGFHGGLKALQAAFANFVIGTFCVSIVACLHRPGWDGLGDERKEGRPMPPWYALFGGPCGAIYVSASIFLSKELGISLFYVMLVTGMMVFSLIIDYKGFLDFAPKTIHPQMVIAVFGLLGGCIMVQDLGNNQSKLSAGEQVGYSILVFFSGFLMPIQAALNRVMQNSVGTPFRAAVVSFSTGTVAVGVVAVIAYAVKGTSTYDGSPWWSWIGGLLGAFFVTAAILSVPLIGAGWYYCLMIASQLCTAFIFDSLGFLGYSKRSASPLRIVGIIVAVLSVILYSIPPLHPSLRHSKDLEEVALDTEPTSSTDTDTTPTQAIEKV